MAANGIEKMLAARRMWIIIEFLQILPNFNKKIKCEEEKVSFLYPDGNITKQK